MLHTSDLYRNHRNENEKHAYQPMPVSEHSISNQSKNRGEERKEQTIKMRNRGDAVLERSIANLLPPEV